MGRNINFFIFNDFNPRSRTGSDGALISPMDFIGLFQPTLPHRERPHGGLLSSGAAGISTHAPAQGATTVSGLTACSSAFQPTLPHRERRWRKWNAACREYFNPRSRTGSDLKKQANNAFDFFISTHAPAQGATDNPPRKYFLSAISTHAPAQGATG